MQNKNDVVIPLRLKKYSLKELESLPTISQGQADDLKKEISYKHTKIRVWLSRMTKEDGMLYNNQVTMEVYYKSRGKWETFKQYQAK